MRDKETEVCLETKSSQGPPPQTDKSGRRADMHSTIHVLFFVCVKAFVLTLSKESKSMHIPKIKMHIMSLSYDVGEYKEYPEGIELFSLYILEADNARSTKLPLTDLSRWLYLLAVGEISPHHLIYSTLTFKLVRRVKLSETKDSEKRQSLKVLEEFKKPWFRGAKIHPVVTGFGEVRVNTINIASGGLSLLASQIFRIQIET